MGKLGEVLAHPEELIPLAKMYYASKQACKLPTDPKLAFCYDILNSVSRSFAIVIQQLPNPLRDAICVFYLVLRGLDTVEDDMALPVATKLPDLVKFHEYIYQRGFSMACGYGHYVRLMRHFGTVVDVFLSLDPRYQAVIADITRRMGAGMAEFVELAEVVTLAQYDLYCHYVAGLVGVGLSQLFAVSGLESDFFSKNEALSDHMGLFLQKANIIRDYLEDINEVPACRMWWPRDVWGRYAKRLEDFKDPAHRVDAVACLNELVTDALRHVPHCIAYMQRLRNPDVLRFCAIPQIMSAGTLALCYNNGDIFEGVVKMRRGETARIFDEVRSMADVHRWMGAFFRQLQHKALREVDPSDPTLETTRTVVAGCIALTDEGLLEVGEPADVVTNSERFGGMVALTLAGAFFYRAWGMGDGSAGAALLGTGPVLPLADAAGLEKYLALVLLAACLIRVIAARP